MATNSFSSPWIPKAPETVGAPVSQQTVLASTSVPQLKAISICLFIDNYIPDIVMSSGTTVANVKHCLWLCQPSGGEGRVRERITMLPLWHVVPTSVSFWPSMCLVSSPTSHTTSVISLSQSWCTSSSLTSICCCHLLPTLSTGPAPRISGTNWEPSHSEKASSKGTENNGAWGWRWGTFRGESGVWIMWIMPSLSHYLDMTVIITQQIFAVKPLPSHISLGGGRRQGAMCYHDHRTQHLT